MLYKEDWEETKQRYLAWWNHEYFGRCALAVTAPKANPPDTVPMPPSPERPEQRWYDLDWISQFNARQHSRTYFGGEALPVWNAGYSGVSSIPTFLGCSLDLDLHTGWWNPILTDPDTFEVKSLKLNKNHPNYAFTMRMLARAAKEAAGKSLASLGAFGGCGDTLAALRGTEQLLMDCIERPDEVREAELYLMDMWCEFYDICYEIVKEVSEGSTCWFDLWSPGKFYPAQNDFAYNIGPDMFREIFLPAIVKQSEFLDHCVYHVDGVGNFRHVEALCEVPGIQAYQIAPGAGKPSAIHYMETCETVQAAGKNLWISLEPHEVEDALGKLSARGLFIHTYAKTEREARELLKKVGQWSVDRG
jgi:hypothetical protein